MAGDWIKLQNTTPDKPEIFQIAETLQMDPDAVLGKLVRIWIWADEQTYDGNAATVTLALLDRVSGVTNFGKAMLSTPWLEQTSAGLVFPNFSRHNGQSAKARGLTARRVRKHKRQKKGNAGSVTPSSLLYSSSSKKKKDPDDVDRVVAHYQQYHPRSRPGGKERGKIRNRLSEGYSVEDLCAAIDGCHKSPYHCGQNDAGVKYQTLELIVRDSTHVATFIEHFNGEARADKKKASLFDD